MELAELRAKIRDIKDFPTEGILFKDITTLLKDGPAWRFAVDALASHYQGERIDVVVGVESRGFIFGGAIAHQLQAGFVPVRKVGKLPWEVEAEAYELEYGTGLLELHSDAVGIDERVLVVDDVLATGGTAAATVRLIERLGASVAGLAFVIELGFLNGRRQLAGRDILSLLHYE